MELVIDKLTKHYGKKIAVDGFSAVLNEGIYALLGSNGSGKTTLMRMLCDVLKPTSGKVSVNGTDIRIMGEEYRGMLGYLPQNFGYYPNFTGFDFMMYLAALKDLSKNAAKKRCEELLDAVGLYDVKNKKIKTYSGGMRQRIGIAQSLINDPDILILDEPTVGLDPSERAKFRNMISSLGKNKLIILSTHIVSDVEYIAENILIMKNGSLAAGGKQDKICECIKNSVWTCTVTEDSAHSLSSKYTVSKKQQSGDKVQMRIISHECPAKGALREEATLEDLYLYHFEEKKNENN